ncbi:MAG: hypothetical protein GF403_09885 [Candidatus Coatesbacteria bacterium]|nr:hypothetical protein [Candidatus Coatesbacteria bacterium]
MTGYIIDNSEGNRLADKLSEMLKDADEARFAVGYLYLSGLEALRDKLGKLKRLQLVIGATDKAAGSILDEALAGTQLKLTPDQIRERQGAIMESLAYQAGTAEPEAELTNTLSVLKRMHEEGRLEVRAYTKGRLHAKAYLITEGKHQLAVVGSSNLTASGFRSNRELNVTEKNDNNIADLHGWFDRLWADSEDFAAELLEVIDESPAFLEAVYPYELYLRMLWELVGERFDETTERKVRRLEGGIFDELADFQRTALLQSIINCREYGGTLIADVVGLGKTYIGLGLMKYFWDHQHQFSVVLCPASLKTMWQELMLKHDIPGRAVSLKKLSRETLPEELASQALAADVVLIDESHNFRNTGTKRYNLLTEQFLADPNDPNGRRKKRKLILLTATPYNRHLPDIYHQLKLFLPESNPPGGPQGKLRHLANFFPKPIEPPSDDATPEEKERYKKEREKYDRKVEQTKQLLGHLMIRRQRSHITRFYPGATIKGRPVTFPERRLNTIRFNLGTSPEHEELYREIVGLIPRDGDTGLTFGRYFLPRYLKTEFEDDKRYRGITKIGPNLLGLMRVLLFKRLESSVFALQETIKRQISAHEFFLQGLDEGYALIGEALSKLIYEGGVDTPEELIEQYPDLAKDYPIEGFELDELKADVESDLAIYRRLKVRAAALDDRRDPKLLELRGLIQKALDSDTKLLVFSEYADTIDGLYAHFKGLFPNADLGRITSNTGRVADVIVRFSPESNNKTIEEISNPIQILFASDVLSEGLNLQDCNAVINFDLHWNPVRLVQRIGRIDRIGTRHETIYAKNFLPVLGEEAGFRLEDILKRRVEEMRRVLGMTAKVLSESDQLDEEAVYTIYSDDADLSGLESDALGLNLPSLEAEGILRKLEREDSELYDKIRNFPLGVRSFKHGDTEKGILACLRKSDLKRFVLVTENAVRDLTESEVIELARCDEDEPLTREPADLLLSSKRGLAHYREELQPTVQQPLSERGRQKRRRLSRLLSGLSIQEPQLNSECNRVLNLLNRETHEKVLHKADQLRQNPHDVLDYLSEHYDENQPVGHKTAPVREYHENPEGPGPTIEQLKSRPHVSSLLGLTE